MSLFSVSRKESSFSWALTSRNCIRSKPGEIFKFFKIFLFRHQKFRFYFHIFSPLLYEYLALMVLFFKCFCFSDMKLFFNKGSVIFSRLFLANFNNICFFTAFYLLFSCFYFNSSFIRFFLQLINILFTN